MVKFYEIWQFFFVFSNTIFYSNVMQSYFKVNLDIFLALFSTQQSILDYVLRYIFRYILHKLCFPLLTFYNTFYNIFYVQVKSCFQT